MELRTSKENRRGIPHCRILIEQEYAHISNIPPDIFLNFPLDDENGSVAKIRAIRIPGYVEKASERGRISKPSGPSASPARPPVTQAGRKSLWTAVIRERNKSPKRRRRDATPKSTKNCQLVIAIHTSYYDIRSGIKRTTCGNIIRTAT